MREALATRFVERARSAACLLVLIAPYGKYFPPKKQREQHGVKALDGGDADAADAVELRGLQVLDVVKLGELAAVVEGKGVAFVGGEFFRAGHKGRKLTES